MPYKSDKQKRFFRACKHGADYEGCPPDDVVDEFEKAEKMKIKEAKGFAKSIMESSKEVNDMDNDAKEGLKKIHSIMKSGGYAHKSYKQSALVSHEYTHPETGHKISVDGWHGTGRYGAGKTIFNLYDSKKGHQPVLEHPPVGPRTTPEDVASHKENIKKITSYLHSNIKPQLPGVKEETELEEGKIAALALAGTLVAGGAALAKHDAANPHNAKAHQATQTEYEYAKSQANPLTDPKKFRKAFEKAKTIKEAYKESETEKIVRKFGEKEQRHSDSDYANTTRQIRINRKLEKAKAKAAKLKEAYGERDAARDLQIGAAAAASERLHNSQAAGAHKGMDIHKAAEHNAKMRQTGGAKPGHFTMIRGAGGMHIHEHPDHETAAAHATHLRTIAKKDPTAKVTHYSFDDAGKRTVHS